MLARVCLESVLHADGAFCGDVGHTMPVLDLMPHPVVGHVRAPEARGQQQPERDEGLARARLAVDADEFGAGQDVGDDPGHAPLARGVLGRLHPLKPLTGFFLWLIRAKIGEHLIIGHGGLLVAGEALGHQALEVGVGQAGPRAGARLERVVLPEVHQGRRVRGGVVAARAVVLRYGHRGVIVGERAEDLDVGQARAVQRHRSREQGAAAILHRLAGQELARAGRQGVIVQCGQLGGRQRHRGVNVLYAPLAWLGAAVGRGEPGKRLRRGSAHLARGGEDVAPGDREVAGGVAVVDLDPHDGVRPVAIQIALGEDAQALAAWADLGVATDAVDDLLRPGGDARVVDHVVQVDADQLGEAGHHEADAGQHAVGVFVRALGGIEVEPLFR